MASPEAPRLTDALRKALMTGSTATPLLEIPFEARKGIVTLHASGASGAATVALDGSIDLLAAVIEGRLTIRPGPGLPDVSARLTGPASAPVRTPELASVARWLAERP